ncbi:HNH endonuclease signature motif containing protein [Flavobacterium sp. MMLR14_040]|uniref:HNH endonuclease signature motif containing protein n=1 Tax=Flavobacterium sp. MMLR14_040 TaxID=3093843 RepID=UPI00298F63DF|nr:HNH endonuclease signature motif containing protein [Flavobacterium sp. MMLR14_040]MDW8849904.1 HNH endonuclease signature motif containing protein [Flavobacterium sp. MMLR14_040]
MKKILLTLIFLTSISYSQETYKIGSTEYIYNQYYSTTGKPVVKRSETNKKIFLNSQGYKATPKGYQIDHIIPLSEGGTDEPYNMQLLTIEQHKQKTAKERGNRGYAFSSTKSSTQNSTSNDLYDPQIITANYSRTDTDGSLIYKEVSGDEYSVNSFGKKSYVKKSSTSYSNSLNSSSDYYPTSSYSPSSNPTTSSRDIQIGPRGGTYYINANGNKTYTKK